MRPKKYPLEPLARLRRERADASVRELAAGIRAREEAEARRVSAEALRARVSAEVACTELAESGALMRGELSAADLQRQGAWQARAQWEDAEAGRAVTELAGREAATRQAESRAKAGVATREAEVKVVAEHHTRWTDDARRAADAADEEGAAEAWQPRAPRR